MRSEGGGGVAEGTALHLTLRRGWGVAGGIAHSHTLREEVVAKQADEL